MCAMVLVTKTNNINCLPVWPGGRTLLGGLVERDRDPGCGASQRELTAAVLIPCAERLGSVILLHPYSEPVGTGSRFPLHGRGSKAKRSSALFDVIGKHRDLDTVLPDYKAQAFHCSLGSHCTNI